MITVILSYAYILANTKKTKQKKFLESLCHCFIPLLIKILQDFESLKHRKYICIHREVGKEKTQKGK
jgi:hypothetical protein